VPRTHVVRPGECLVSLAKQYGFASAADLHEHPENEGLRGRRPDPHVLAPGDRVVIPDRDDKQEPCATGREHRFRVKIPRAVLRLALEREHGEPYANKPYELRVAGETRTGTTDGDGRLEEPVPADATEALLVIEVQASPRELRRWHLHIGHLDPVDDEAGVRSRLQNLGVHAAPGEAGLAAALRKFQKRHELTEDGALSAETKDKLREIHGS